MIFNLSRLFATILSDLNNKRVQIFYQSISIFRLVMDRLILCNFCSVKV